MRQYELTYLISDDVQESEITKITGKIGGIIAESKGKVLKEESWGRRKLAYPIKKLLFATYITINFELEPENLRNIERDLRHESSIVRYLLTVKNFGKEKLSLSAEDVAATRDIEQVVGGKKSFEAVKGETEESKDLMAVRGEKENIEKDTHRSLSSASAPPTRDGQIDTDGEKSEEPKEAEKTKKEKATETSVEGIPTKSVGKEKKPEIIEEVLAPAVELVVEKVQEEKSEKIEKKTVAKKAPHKVPTSPVGEDQPTAEKIEKEEEIKIEKIEKPQPKADQPMTDAIEKKPIKKKAVKKDSTASDEADRLAKLDEELNDILGEEL